MNAAANWREHPADRLDNLEEELKGLHVQVAHERMYAQEVSEECDQLRRQLENARDVEEERDQLRRRLEAVEQLQAEKQHAAAALGTSVTPACPPYWKDRDDHEIAFRVPAPPASVVGSYREFERSPASVQQYHPDSFVNPTFDARSPPHHSPADSHRHKMVTPNKYDGRSPWRDYAIHFRACMKLNKWNEGEAAEWLATRLEGEAVAVLAIDNRGVYTFSELAARLEERFGRGLSAENYLMELRAM